MSFGNQIFWMSNTGIVCRKPLGAGILTSNYINTVGDNDLVFARNGVGFFRLANAPAGYPILNWTNTTPSSGISSSVTLLTLTQHEGKTLIVYLEEIHRQEPEQGLNMLDTIMLTPNWFIAVLLIILVVTYWEI